MNRIVLEVIADLWREILTPSPPDEKPYKFALIAIGHAILGATFSFAGLLFGFAYWLIKERKDLRRNGSLMDGLIDTGFVLVGTQYSGPEWWPITIVLLAGFGGVLKETVRRLKTQNGPLA